MTAPASRLPSAHHSYLEQAIKLIPSAMMPTATHLGMALGQGASMPPRPVASAGAHRPLTHLFHSGQSPSLRQSPRQRARAMSQWVPYEQLLSLAQAPVASTSTHTRWPFCTDEQVKPPG